LRVLEDLYGLAHDDSLILRVFKDASFRFAVARAVSSAKRESTLTPDVGIVTGPAIDGSPAVEVCTLSATMMNAALPWPVKFWLVQCCTKGVMDPLTTLQVLTGRWGATPPSGLKCCVKSNALPT
jgi:hypothetical protein